RRGGNSGVGGYSGPRLARRPDKRVETIPPPGVGGVWAPHRAGHGGGGGDATARARAFTPRGAAPGAGGGVRAPPPPPPAPGGPPAADCTLEATEREAIQRTLRETNGVLGGPRGAATRLGMKRTTLQSRMRKLGIQSGRQSA